MIGRLIPLLYIAPVFAGQSLVLTSNQSQATIVPGVTMGPASFRVEAFIHDWGDALPDIVFRSWSYSGGFYLQGYHGGPVDDRVFWTDSGVTGYSGSSCQISLPKLDYQQLIVRFQRDAVNRIGTCEAWGPVGGKWISIYSQIYSFTSASAGSGNFLIDGALDVAFFRMQSTILPLNSVIPLIADNTNTILNFKFDGNFTDSSSNGGFCTVTGGSSFATTPALPTVARIKAGATLWSDSTSIRAGYPATLDGTASYSQADASSAVTYQWSQASPGGPTTLSWNNPTLAQPTITGAVFGDYTIGLVVTDVNGNQGETSVDVGAVATDDNGVVINENPAVDQIFGPMIAFGRNPWGFEDYLAMQATSARFSDYQTLYGLSATWPYAPWETPLPGTVSYTWDGVGMAPISAPGTTISSEIPSSGPASFTVTNVASLDLSELPTRVYVWAASAPFAWEEIRICSVQGNTLTPCYDGRGWSDPNSSRLSAQAWPAGSNIGQFKVTGQGTAFLSSLCQGGAQSPVGQVAYSAGAVSVTAGSANVKGKGVSWSSPAVLPNDAVVISATHGGQPFVFVANISSLTDASNLVLSRPFPADADSGAYSYSIVTTGEASSQAPFTVLHYTRPDGSDAMRYWPEGYACESDTSLYLEPYWDDPAYDRSAQEARSYTWMPGNWWINESSTGGLDFYGEDLAHRALYYRSGLTMPLNAANMIGDMWVSMPMISGKVYGIPLFNGGLAIGGIADAMLSTTPHKVQWSDLRGFASQGVTLLGGDCSSAGDSRDTGYQLAWLALAALYDPDTTSTAAPGGIPWRSYWRKQLSPMYARELGCKRNDNSWASGFYWNNSGDRITLTGGSDIGAGTNISNPGACLGIASGTGTAANGSGVISGSGFVSGTRIAIAGTKSGAPFTMWQYYTLNSSSQITLNLGATWQGDTGAITWMVDNGSNFTVFMQSNDDPMGAEQWSCIRNSNSQIALNRPWDGPSGTYWSYQSNVAGIAQQPYMLGIRQAAWRWASLAASAAGNSTLAANFDSLRYAAGMWIRTTGFDSAITNGMFYSRVQSGCEPITPASMGGGCFSASPSNSAYDAIAMRELTAEGSPSLWSYADSGALDKVTWGDLAYGSLWGYAPHTAPGYCAPTDQLTEQNASAGAASPGIFPPHNTGKWTGFFFGMGMAHQWPAIRLGGVQPPRDVNTSVPFSLPAGAVQVQVTLTAPSGAVGAPFVCTSTCAAATDARQGAYWAHLVYQDSSGGTVSTADELLSTTPNTRASAGLTIQTADASAIYSASDQTVTLSANVTGSLGTLDEGTVTFTVRGCSQIGSATTTSRPVSGGAASAGFTLPGGTPAGIYSIQAVYNGLRGFVVSNNSAALLTIR
jgi:hypothetical protein